MALIQSNYAKGIVPIPYPTLAGAVVAHRFFIDLAAAPALNDIIELAALPADCRVIDVVIDSDDLDSGTTIAWDVGIMSGDWGVADNARTCGNEFFAASAVSQAGGVARMTKKEGARQASAARHRSIGLKVQAAATGFQAGQIAITLSVVAA